ncbi:ankyrin repeat-containing domain protein [Xylariomycetidae sp. FL0641]|nr:ankyrin repeat-containing domain protein [Xylariomycetidae sp. FL0641]
MGCSQDVVRYLSIDVFREQGLTLDLEGEDIGKWNGWIESDKIELAEKHPRFRIFANHNCVAILKGLVAAGEDLNQVDSIGCGAFHYAAATCTWKSVRWLLSQPTLDPNRENDMGQTALHGLAWARVQGSHLPFCEEIIARTTDAESLDVYGQAPFLRAAQCGTLTVLKALWGAGAGLSLWGGDSGAVGGWKKPYSYGSEMEKNNGKTGGKGEGCSA